MASSFPHYGSKNASNISNYFTLVWSSSFLCFIRLPPPASPRLPPHRDKPEGNDDGHFLLNFGLEPEQNDVDGWERKIDVRSLKKEKGNNKAHSMLLNVFGCRVHHGEQFATLERSMANNTPAAKKNENKNAALRCITTDAFCFSKELTLTKFVSDIETSDVSC